MKNEDDFIAKEPEAIYQANKTTSEQHRVPDYVWEDLKIGLEQYERGEYVAAESLLNSIKFGI